MIKAANRQNGPAYRDNLTQATKKEGQFGKLVEPFLKTASLLPKDFLEVLNERGADIIFSGKMKPGNAATYVENGTLCVSKSIAHSYSGLAEEVIHCLDFRIGFTLRKAWQNAFRQDFSGTHNTDAANFVRLANEHNGKDNIFDSPNYNTVSRALELLPDLNYIDLHFDSICRSIEAKTRLRLKEAQAQPDKKDEADILAFHAQNIRQLHHNKDEIMQHYFPHTWPLYKDFLKEIGRDARKYHNVRQAQPYVANPWIGRVRPPSAGPSLPPSI